MAEKSRFPTVACADDRFAPGDRRALTSQAVARFGRASLLGIVASCLSGCGLIVLDPKGPVGKGDATILIDSVVIMLAIIVPTSLAIFAFACGSGPPTRERAT